MRQSPGAPATSRRSQRSWREPGPWSAIELSAKICQPATLVLDHGGCRRPFLERQYG